MSKRGKIILFITVLFIIFLFGIYDVYISYSKITITNHSITTNKINNFINLVIISDLHDNQLGENNKDLIDNINFLSPDMVLIVGDMLNKDSKNSNTVTNLMKQLCKNYKVFYSLGNTEKNYIEARTSNLVEELENLGVTVLDDEYKDVNVNGNIIRIGGIYDYAFDTKKYTQDFLSKFEDTDNYKIMLAHRPDSFIFNNVTKDWNIDLVVSGHTHGGQVVLPFAGGLYAAEQGWFPKYDKGLFDFDDTKILITSGLGSGKEILPRFNNTPEVVDLKLCE